MDGVLSLVSRAEASLRHRQTDLHDQYLHQAHELLRGAYKMHWGGSSARQLFAHGSHLVVSNPMLNLLHAFNASTLRQLSRDLSPFTTQSLLRMITVLNSQYESALWDGGIEVPNGDGFVRAQHRVHFQAGGSVAMFPLQLRTLSSQDNFGTSEDGLLSEYVFDSLRTLLDCGNVSSPVGNQESGICTLVIISPLPVVHHDPQLLEGTFVTAETLGMVYSPTEVLRLLDILCNWASKVPGREVVIVAGGVDVGHGTTIVGQPLNFSEAPPEEEEEEMEEMEEEESNANKKAMKVLGESVPSIPGSPVGSPTLSRKMSSKEVQPTAAKSRWGFASAAAALITSPMKEEKKVVENKGPTAAEVEAERKREERKEARNKARVERNLAKRKARAIRDQEAARKAMPVVIRQICVAPLVGVPGHDVPVNSGIMVSDERAYTYQHDHLEHRPHCGFMQIFDNRANVAASLDVARSMAGNAASVAPPLMAVKGTQLDIIDHFTMRSFVQDDDTGDTNNIANAKKYPKSDGTVVVADNDHNNAKLGLDLSVIKDSNVIVLWKHASAHLSGNRKKKADVPQDPEAMDLSLAITTALDDDPVMAVYPFVHRAVFVTGSLSLPMSGGVAVEDTLLAAARILLSNLPREIHELCPMPSSLVMRLVWSKLIRAEAKLHEKAEASGNISEKLPSPVEMVVASLAADTGYMAYALRQAIEAQALLEYFAEVLGYNDIDI